MLKKPILVILVLALPFSLVLPLTVMAAPATLSVQPQTTVVTGIGESFTINVTVADITNLYGWEFKLYYRSAILNGTVIDEGPFLRTGGETTHFNFWLNDVYNATHGRAWATCTRLGFIPGVNGTGILATVTFKTKGIGNSDLHFDDIILGSPEAEPIQHTTTDGYVEVRPGPNTPPSLVGVPNLWLDEDTTLDNAIDLWEYASDTQTPDEDLIFTILSVDYPEIGIAIDSNRYVDVEPTANWNGRSIVTVQVSDPGGLADPDSFEVIVNSVNDPPVVSNIPNQRMDEGDVFTDIHLDDYVEDVDNIDSEITWTYSGNTDLTVNISVDRVATVSTPIDWYGSETITFTARDPLLLTDSDSASFTVTETPHAAFTWSPSIPEAGQRVTFDASASTPGGGYIMDYEWDFDGDGFIDLTAFEPTAEHTYTVFGEYLVTLKITNSEGKWGTELKTLTVSAKPTADFTWSPFSPFVYEEVTFDASSSKPNGGTIISYEWSFGDGSNSNGEIVVHSFSNLGTFTVTLNVLDSEGKFDLVQKLVTVTTPQIRPPHAEFTWFPSYPEVGETVTFDASASTPNGGILVSYTWSFGDGTPSATEDSPFTTHQFAAPGNYTVTLMILDSEDKSDVASETVEVVAEPQPPGAPHADFTWSPFGPGVNETVTFDASASTPDGGYLVSYTWSFGDGTSPVTDDSPFTTHQFAAPGNYTVTLTIVDSEGESDVASETVEVVAEPQPPDTPHADFTWSPFGPGVNETVTFDASASTPNGGILVSYTWSFGDGNTTTVTDPVVTHIYASAGSYAVTLNVTDSQDLWDVATNQLTVTSEGLIGDLNHDGVVDIFDMVIFALAFGSEPGDPNWNPEADLKNDGVIDIFDAVFLIINFGKSP